MAEFSRLACLAVMLAGTAQAEVVNTGYFGNVAIRGYDAVAYFTEAKAESGKPEFSWSWLGAEWYFSSERHRDLFIDNPTAYAPQYGGLCSDGVAYNTITVNIDPTAWRIINGKLYLNFDQGAAAEIEESPGILDRADANWPKIRETMAANANAK